MEHAAPIAESSTARPLPDLEGFKRAEKLRWQDLAEMIGANSPSQAYKWATGKDFPGAARLYDIRDRLGGRVSVEAMLRRFA